MIHKFVDAVEAGNYKSAQQIWVRGNCPTSLAWSEGCNAVVLVALNLHVPEMARIWKDYEKYFKVAIDNAVVNIAPGCDYATFCSAMFYELHTRSQKIMRSQVDGMLEAFRKLGFKTPNDEGHTLDMKASDLMVRTWALQSVQAVNRRYKVSWVLDWTYNNILRLTDMEDYDPDFIGCDAGDALVAGLWASVSAISSLNASTMARERARVIRVKKCGAVAKYLREKKHIKFLGNHTNRACASRAIAYGYRPDFMRLFLSDRYVNAYLAEFCKNE